MSLLAPAIRIRCLGVIMPIVVLSVLVTAVCNYLLWGYVFARPDLVEVAAQLGGVTQAARLELLKDELTVEATSVVIDPKSKCNREACELSATWFGKTEENYYCGAACLAAGLESKLKKPPLIENAIDIVPRLFDALVLKAWRFPGVEQLRAFPKGDDMQVWLYSSRAPVTTGTISASYLIAVDYQASASDDDRRVVLSGIIDEHVDRSVEVRVTAGYIYEIAGLEFTEWQVLFPAVTAIMLLIAIISVVVSARR